MSAAGEHDVAGGEHQGELGPGAANFAAMAGGAERRASGPTVGEFYGGLADQVENDALAGRLDRMSGSQEDRIWTGPDAPYNATERHQPPETEGNARAEMAQVVRTVDMAMQGTHTDPTPGLNISFDIRDEFRTALRRQVDQLLGMGGQPIETPKSDRAGHTTARYATQLPGLQVDIWTESENKPGGKVLETRYNLVPVSAQSERAA